MSDALPSQDQPTLAITTTTADAPAADHFADFVLLNELGRGGMGVVYRALEPALNRHVALKMILSGNLSTAEELSRFNTEVRAAASLSHSNIVKVHRVGVHDGRHYFSMDLIDGTSLAEKLKEGPLPGRTAAQYLVTIARAIQHAHDQSILHRDIKPGNILIDRNGSPHVTDFGLAKQLSADSSNTRTGALLGTPSYMAPEQAQANKEIGPAADVYGLGALLYELLTARPPFVGETPFHTIMQVIESDPAPPRLLNKRIQTDLETICLKCLSKNPRDRYGSAAALADDLERFLAGDSISARSMNMIDYVGKALERSNFDQEFRPYGNLILWFAVVVGVMHLVKHFLISWHLPFWTILLAYVVQFVVMGLAVPFCRPKGFLPTSTAERLLWAGVIGYVLSCALVGHLTRMMFGFEAVYEKKIYPFYAILAGLLYCVLGSSYWGKLYAMAGAFFVLAFVMQLDLYWATLEFGGLWVLALSLIGFRLRRLGAERGQSSEASRSSKK